MRHGSLFSGIGGFDLAAEWMGWENVFHCEWNEFGQKVLKHHFPKADSYSDITKTDFTKYADTIDILTGGFPCQPFSLAGKRRGTDDERYLWHEMLRAIQEVKPKFVIAENVYGIVNIDGGMVFEQVCIDLENEGYEVQPFVIPACAKDAPHRRDRVWFVAYSNGNGKMAQGRNRDSNNIERNSTKEIQERENEQLGIDGSSNERSSSYSDGTGREKQHVAKKSSGEDNNSRNALHTNSTSKQGQYIGQKRERELDRPNSGDGINNFSNFPTQSPICSGDDGLPTELDGITLPKWRNESIKAYGNAIVPQVAFTIFKAICTIS